MFHFISTTNLSYCVTDIGFVHELQVAPTLVPLLKFYFHEEVRKAAVSGISLLSYFIFVALVNNVCLITIVVGSYARASSVCKISCREGASSGT